MHVEFFEGVRTKSDGQERKVDFVRVHTGRDGKDVVERPATEADKARWPDEYEAYKPSKPAEPVAVEPPKAKSKK